MAKFQRLVNNALIFYSCLLTTGILTLALPTEELKRIHDNTKFSEDLKLRLVSTVFRHGDRTLEGKIESYPNDPHKNISFNEDPNNKGQLTNVGKKRAYDLGLLLRDRYNSFLGDMYYPSNVYARSTAVTRTKMTLQLVLAGLYPPVDIQKWNSKLLWQPTDMAYTSIDKDKLLFPITCARYHKVCKDQEESPEVKERIEEFNDLMKDCSKHTGHNITSLIDLYNLYNTLYAESCMDLDLPEWTQDIYPNGKLLDAALLFLELLSYDQLNNLNGGVLLKWIINDMNKIIAGTQVKKINLFSAHDINVAAILHALNIPERRFPGYTSSVIIELYESDKKYFVKVLYYSGNPLETVVEVEIPGCEVLCPYDKFIELTESIETSESCHSVNLGEICTLLAPFITKLQLT